MGARERFVALGRVGPNTQIAVAGAYAWASTVAPVAWSSGGGVATKAAAVLALVVLGGGWFVHARWGERARIAGMWAFVLSCALCWSTAPGVFPPSRTDSLRGITGALAWGLFAFAYAGPALQAPEAEPIDDEPLDSRKRWADRSRAVLLGAALLAGAFQCIGWESSGAERAVFARILAVAAGLAAIDASVAIALLRRRRSARR